MEKEKLKKMFTLTATNFKFNLDEDFGIFFEMIHEKVKNVPDELLTKRFQQLWLRTTEEWNKEYGFAGYPSFADWIFILTGKRALNDKQIEEEREQHEKHLKNIVDNVAFWISTQREDDGRAFAVYYLEHNAPRTKALINRFYNITNALTYDEARELCLKIREEAKENWEELSSKLLLVARDQNQLLLD